MKKDKATWSGWVALLMLGAIEAILLLGLPRVLTHVSRSDLHQVLYLNRSPAYWVFMVAYLCCAAIGAVLCFLLLTKRSIEWVAAPARRFLLTPHGVSVADLVLLVVATAVVASIPEVLARVVFISRYHAPASLLVPYVERFDQNMAIYGYTQRSGQMAQNDVIAFRQSHFEYRPYVGFTPLPEFRPTPARAKKASRVFFIGGSAMEISAAPIARDVQDRLDRAGCRVEVVNAGRSAYVSGQELIMTLMEVVPLQPDLIIVFDGYNDLSRVEEGETPGAPEYTRAMARAFAAGSNVYQYLLNDLVQRSFLLQLLTWRRSGEAALAADGRDLFDEAAEIYGSNVEKMFKLASAYDYELIVAVQPLVFFKDHLGPSEAPMVGRVPKRAALYQRYYPRLIEHAMAAAGRERQVRDLSRVFVGLPGDVFYDAVHFDGESAAVRNVLSREFEQMIRSHGRACEGDPRPKAH